MTGCDEERTASLAEVALAALYDAGTSSIAVFSLTVVSSVTLTITRKLEIPEDRTLVIKLPDTVPPGPHEVVVIVREETTDRTSSDSNAEELMRFAGTIQSFSGIDGLEYQRHIRAEWE